MARLAGDALVHAREGKAGVYVVEIRRDLGSRFPSSQEQQARQERDQLPASSGAASGDPEKRFQRTAHRGTVTSAQELSMWQRSQVRPKRPECASSWAWQSWHRLDTRTCCPEG
jgi:hypothetical protein